MLQIRALSGLGTELDDDAAVDKLFGPKFLLERPLLEALRCGDGAVLLIDEVDRADDEFEAFLLELLSDYQITIPEIGTIRAEAPPLVVLTSNRTRELHDALKRRCLYHWVGYPTAEREVEIVLIREPGVSKALADKVVAAVHRLRELELNKPPGVAETIDWVRSLDVLGATELDAQAVEDTIGAVIKERDDLDIVHDNLDQVISLA
jgi:MoxR-like ATPase